MRKDNLRNSNLIQNIQLIQNLCKKFFIRTNIKKKLT